MKDKIINIIKRINLQSRGLHIAIIAIFTILSYANTLNNDFAWDDSTFIVGWYGPKYIENISYLLEGLSPSDHAGVFRPARGIFYLISYHIWGVNPQGYHLQALLIQLAVTLIFYFIIYAISKDKLLSFIASMLFGTHPIHTEAIAFTTASFDTISFIFFGLSFLLYIKFDQFKEKKERIICLIGTLLYGSIAILTYEMALSLPLVCLSYDLIFKKFKGKTFQEKKIFYLLFGLLISIYGIVRFFIFKGPLRGNISLFSFLIGSITAPEIYIKTLFLFVYPFVQQPYEQLNLNLVGRIINIQVIIQGFAQQVINSHITLSELLPILSFLIILIAIFFIFVRLKKNELLKFSIVWIIITMLPSLNFIPKGQIFADRYPYLASLGYCIILSIIFCNILRFSSKQKFKFAYLLTVILFSITILSYSYFTYLRNSDWKNSGTLFNASYYMDPTNVTTIDSLAAYYLGNHQPDVSLSLMKQAIILNPQSAPAYTHLGVIYQALKDEDNAKKSYFKAIKLDQNQSDAYFGLGVYALNEKKYNDAEVFLKNAVRANDKSIKAHVQLANLYSMIDHNDLAIKELKIAYQLNPLDTNTNTSLANLYRITNQPKEGIKVFSDMIASDPNNSYDYFLMGTYLTQIEEYTDAEKNLLIAIDLENNNPDYYNGLGLAYIHMNKTDEAIEQFQKSIKLNPAYTAGINNLNLALKTKETK